MSLYAVLVRERGSVAGWLPSVGGVVSGDVTGAVTAGGGASGGGGGARGGAEV